MHEFLRTLVRRRRNGKDRMTSGFSFRFECGLMLLGIWQIYFIEYYNLRTRGELFIVFVQLAVDDLKILPGITIGSCTIQHMNQQTGTLNMAQKFMAEAHPLRCSLNQTWNIGQYKAIAIALPSLPN